MTSSMLSHPSLDGERAANACDVAAAVMKTLAAGLGEAADDLAKRATSLRGNTSPRTIDGDKFTAAMVGAPERRRLYIVGDAS